MSRNPDSYYTFRGRLYGPGLGENRTVAALDAIHPAPGGGRAAKRAARTPEPEPTPDPEAEAPQDTDVEEPDTPPEVEVVRRGGGWFDVTVDGEQVNDSALRHDDAEALADQHRA